MKLGDKVYFIDTDGCMAIRKATVTCIKDTHGYVDFLSSRHDKKYISREYVVCAVKAGVHQYFETRFVFESIESIKEYFAEIEFEKYDLLE